MHVCWVGLVDWGRGADIAVPVCDKPFPAIASIFLIVSLASDSVVPERPALVYVCPRITMHPSHHFALSPSSMTILNDSEPQAPTVPGRALPHHKPCVLQLHRKVIDHWSVSLCGVDWVQEKEGGGSFDTFPT